MMKTVQFKVKVQAEFGSRLCLSPGQSDRMPDPLRIIGSTDDGWEGGGGEAVQALVGDPGPFPLQGAAAGGSGH